jgi:hypothetical protein
MAARRITQAEREAATDAQSEFLGHDDAAYDADTEEAINNFRDSLAGAENKGTLWVYRLPTDERGEVIAAAKPASLFSAPIDRFELEELGARLRSQYMKPGERAVFRLTVTQRGTQGLRLNRLLILERERVEEAPNARESMTEILRVIQESNQAAADRTERLLGALHVQRAAAPATDPMQQSLAIVAAITGLTHSLVRQSPMTAPASSSDPMATMETTMRVMARMRSFFDGGGGDGEGDPDGLASILRAAGPIVATIGELARRPAMLPAQAAPARRRGVRAAPGAAPAVAPATAQQEVEPMIAQLRPQFEALTQAARDGGDPLAVAPLVLEAIPEGSPVEARFVEFLQRPNWFATVVAVYAPAREHAEWFLKLRDAILAEFEADGASDA